MPIRPELKHHYTKAAGWPEIRAAILARATRDMAGFDADGAPYLERVPRCESCGVPNHWYRRTVADATPDEQSGPTPRRYDVTNYDPGEATRIVLTIAHLDHNPANNNAGNLRALCQRCHLAHDAEKHRATRRASLIAAQDAGASLFTTTGGRHL